jgi:hypothetical protein
MATPEEATRVTILDAALNAAGWAVQDIAAANLYASCGVAIREFPLKSGFGEADYLLFVDGEAVGAGEHGDRRAAMRHRPLSCRWTRCNQPAEHRNV